MIAMPVRKIPKNLVSVTCFTSRKNGQMDDFEPEADHRVNDLTSKSI